MVRRVNTPACLLCKPTKCRRVGLYNGQAGVYCRTYHKWLVQQIKYFIFIFFLYYHKSHFQFLILVFMALPLLCILVYRCRTAVLLFGVDGFPTANNRTDVQAAAISRTCVLLFMTDAFPGINNRTHVQRNQKFSRTCVLLFVVDGFPTTNNRTHVRENF